MRRTLTLAGFVAIFSVLSLAETFTGRLIDASCADQPSQARHAATCIPTSSTTAFALDASGTVYKLDAAGNQKAQAALKSRADRSKDQNSPPAGHITAKISGTLEGDMLKVDNLEVQ